MPRIVVTTEATAENPDRAVLLDERIVTTDLASGHFAAQLIERIGWALLDADAGSGEDAAVEPIKRRLVESPHLGSPLDSVDGPILPGTPSQIGRSEESRAAVKAR